MIFLFDILLVISLIFLPLIKFSDGATRKGILVIFLLSQAILLIRRLTDSIAGILCVMLTFFAVIFAAKAYKLFAKSDYIVISKDIQKGTITASDGKNFVTVAVDTTENYNVGEIVRIVAKSD